MSLDISLAVASPPVFFKTSLATVVRIRFGDGIAGMAAACGFGAPTRRWLDRILHVWCQGRPIAYEILHGIDQHGINAGVECFGLDAVNGWQISPAVRPEDPPTLELCDVITKRPFRHASMLH